VAKILVVDDVPTNRRLLSSVLKASGHVTLQAENGAAALELIHNERPDLVVTDILMPVMDGFELARRIRADATIAQTSIIFYTTTFRGPEARTMASLCGVRTLLPKPCNAKLLLAAVNKELGIEAPAAELALPSLEAERERPGGLEERLAWYRQEIGELTLLSQEIGSAAAAGDGLARLHERFLGSFTKLRHFSGALSTLVEATLNCSPERGAEHVGSCFFEAACKMTDSAYVVLCLGEATSEHRRRVWTSGLDSTLYDDAAALRAPLIALLRDEETRRPVRRDVRAGSIEGLPAGHPAVASFAGIPVCSRDWQYGWIYFAAPSTAKPLSEEDESILATLAGELAVFYENALMYDLLQRHASQLQMEVVRREAAEERDKQRERQLAQAQKMEAVGQLTGGIAHDFNNLLTVVQANAEELEEHFHDAPTQAEQARLILSAAKRGAGLVRQLLAFARKQDLRPEVVEATKIVESAVALLKRTLPESMTIDVTRKRDGAWINVDPASLQSALLNLALNARDAMPDGGSIAVELSECRLEISGTPRDYLRIAVRDTGHGMSDEVLAKAFEPFFTTKAVGAGSGLGLSMVYGFAQQSGGQAEIKSAPGEGTTVSLYLPLTQPPATAAAAPTAAPAPRSRGAAILLVEDDELVRQSVEAKLSRLGHKVTAVATAGAALAALERDASFDLVFTDIIMPGGMSGADLARNVMSRWKSVKVLATSGYTESNLLGKVEIPAGVLLLRKPYSTAELTTALAAVVGPAAASK
jgi:signal transduction histidine kinase/DNA-binding response OmpR family regulator